MNSRSGQYNYINAEENLRRLIVISEFLLVKNLESELCLFLRHLREDNNFAEFKSTIDNVIEEYDVSDEAIYEAICGMIPVC